MRSILTEPLNKSTMEYYISKDVEKTDKYIPMPDKSNKYYQRLSMFQYIGVKYFAYDLD